MAKAANGQLSQRPKQQRAKAANGQSPISPEARGVQLALALWPFGALLFFLSPLRAYFPA
jgi:hypothetical protein